MRRLNALCMEPVTNVRDPVVSSCLRQITIRPPRSLASGIDDRSTSIE